MKNLVIKCFRLFISYKLPHEGYDTVGFKAIDQNKDGIININELEEIVGPTLASEIMGCVDLNGDDKIELSEFAHAAIDFKKVPDDLFRSAFNYFDKDKNGVISMEEMELHVNNVAHYWQEIGKEIDYNEFKKLIQN